MTTKRNLPACSLAFIAMIWLVISGCTKDTTVIVEPKPVAITRTVSFAKDIVPVFSASCNMTGCHNSGGHKPDLSKDKAYTALKDGSYLNTQTPESSDLYLWLTGKRATSMPMGAPNDPSSINELVLAWIKQGAKNN